MTSSEPVLLERPDPPYATYALLAGCWLMALVTFPGDQDALTIRLFRFGAKENAALVSGELWRLLTTAFLHGGFIHLLVNSYSLYVLGRLIERVLGQTRFLATYFVSAATGSLSSWAFNSHLGVGASGAIFGLLGTALYLSWRGKTAHIPPTALRSLGMWTIYNLVYGFITPTIDNAAHLGGMAGGVLCAALLTSNTLSAGLVAASLATLAWAGVSIARTADVTPQVTAFLESDRARTAGDSATELVRLEESPDFAPAVATLAFRKLEEGQNREARALADSAARLSTDSTSKGIAYRRAADLLGIDSRRLQSEMLQIAGDSTLIDSTRPSETADSTSP